MISGRISIRNLLLVILLFYFVVQVVLRVVLSPGALELDEAEQLVWTQKWSWGYASQPPLYSWLQILFFNVFGLSVLSLALLKNLLLSGVYIFTHLNARLITRNPLASLAAPALVLFFPEISWQSQIDRTHSVLALFLVCATLFCLLKLTADRRFGWFAGFGLCAGLLLISKYNAAVFLAGLLAAAMTLPEYRRALLDTRMLAAGAVLLAVFLPNAIWMLRHPEQAMLTSSKLHVESGSAFINFSGLGRTLFALVVASLPMLLLHALVFRRIDWVARLANMTPPVRLLWRTGLFVLGLLIAGVLVFHVTEIRERWLHPLLLILLPVISIALFEDLLDAKRLKWILVLAAAVMVAVTAGVVTRVVLAGPWKLSQRLNFPIATLAPVMAGPLQDVPVVITETALFGGDLRLNLPGRTYVPPEMAALLAPDAKRFALVWDASRRDLPGDRTVEFLREAGADFAKAEIGYFAAPHRFQSEKQMRLGLAVLEKEKNGWPITRGVR